MTGFFPFAGFKSKNILTCYTYRGVELDGVLSDHSSDALVGAVAAVVARVHLPVILSPDVLDCDDTVGHVQLQVAARGRVYDDHDGDAVLVLVTDEAGALVGVRGVQLDQVSAVAQLPLHLVLKLVGRLLPTGLIAAIAALSRGSGGRLSPSLSHID